MWYFFLLACLFLGIFWRYRSCGISHPVNFIYGLAFLYFVLKYWLYSVLEIDPLDGMLLADLTPAGAYLLLFWGCTSVTLLVLTAQDVRLPTPDLRFIPRFPLGWLAYGAMLLTLTILLGVAGPSVLLQPLKVREILTSQGMYYWSIVLLFVTTYYYLWLYYRRQWGAFACFAMLYILFAFIMGRAALQVGLILNLLLVRGMVLRKSIFALAALMLPFLVLYVVVTGIHRDLSRTGTIALSDVVEKFVQGGGKISDDLVKATVARFLWRIDNLDSLALLVNTLHDEKMAFSYGENMSQVVIQWVPRVLWPDKPNNFTIEMTKQLRPDVFYEAAGNNFSGIGEVYYNFNVVGIPIFAMGFGLMMYWASRCWAKRRGSFEYAFFLVAMAYPALGSCVLSGFINDIALPNVVIQTVLLLGIFRMVPREEPVCSGGPCAAACL